jgi:hypothetical protein
MTMTTIRPTARRALSRREEALMSTTETTRPHNDIERLLQDVAASPSVQLRVDSGDGLFIVWLSGENAPRCGCHADTWWTAGTDHWHVMAQFSAVKRVRFVREPDAHAPEHETLSIRLVGANGSSLRASFAPLYDDRDQPIAAQFGRWEELRAKYGGRDEARVEEGMLVPGLAQ